MVKFTVEDDNDVDNNKIKSDGNDDEIKEITNNDNQWSRYNNDDGRE